MTDKKIEEILEKKDRDGDYRDYVVGNKLNTPTTRFYLFTEKELTDLLNTEVQKAREDGVRGYQKFVNDNGCYWIGAEEQYLQSLDKGDGE